MGFRVRGMWETPAPFTYTFERFSGLGFTLYLGCEVLLIGFGATGSQQIQEPTPTTRCLARAEFTALVK